MNRKTLSFKLIAGGLVLVFVPVLIIGLVSVWKSSSSLSDEARLRSIEIVKGLSNMTNLVLLEKMKLVSEIAMREDVIDAVTKASSGMSAAPAETPTQPETSAASAPTAAPVAGAVSAGYPRLTTELTNMMKVGKEYEVIYLADVKGNLFLDSVGGKTSDLNVNDRDYFNEAKAGKVNFGKPALSRLSGKPSVNLAAPVYSKTGEFVGIVGMIIHTDFLIEKFAGIKIGETGYAYLLDREGILIAHPNKEFILQKNLLKEAGMEGIAPKMLSRQIGADVYNFLGVKKIGGYAPVEASGWMACVTQNYDELMAPAHVLRNFIFVIGLIFLAITAVAVFFWGRKISLPITKAVNDLNDGALQIAGAAGQVSGTSQILSEGASEAAASIEETSSSLEELSSMTRKNAENANYSKTLMAEARKIVDKVNQNMNQMTAAIAEVTKSSEETGKIIKTIDEIAFQTNLLALNAAVEAARAGEAGSGFAVVADEVRNLAMRASEAAKSTSDLIENTIAGIRNSNDLTSLTHKAFQETIEITGKIGNLVDEIASASDEQAGGIDQINKAIAELDKVTQQNAANAEEAAGASEELSAQAEQMKQIAVDLAEVVGGATGQADGQGYSQSKADSAAPRTGVKKIQALLEDKFDL